MTGEQITEREAILAARVKELEDAAAASAVTVAQGGVFESLWRTINSIVPPWLAAAALAVFIAHYGFAFYLQGQVTAAETEAKQAKADAETAKAAALNEPDAQGTTTRLATLKAEIDNKRADAAAAKARATALSAEVNGETMALRSAKAQLDTIQNQARLAQAKADAEGAKFGLATLEDRAVKVKLIKQQLAVFNAKGIAAYNQEFEVRNALSQRPLRAQVQAQCDGNPYAEFIDCPAQFIHRKPQAPQVASVTSNDSSEDWKPRGACAGQLAGFNRESVFGSFALTRRAKGGQSGCAWGAGAGKSRERVRREALELCARQGADCKIISEK
jgi:hypothetical protein